MYSLENKSEESRAFQSNPEKQLPTAQFKDNRAQSPIGTSDNTVQREKKENLTGMPDDLKSGIESLSGFSMDDVRVHYNSSKPATVQALAYTQGTDIHVAPGQEKHLPHEAWHVAQQMAGRVSPTTNINGMPVNDNAELEHEADVMGAKAVQRKKENTSDLRKIDSSLDRLTKQLMVDVPISEPISQTLTDEDYKDQRFDWNANFTIQCPTLYELAKGMPFCVVVKIHFIVSSKKENEKSKKEIEEDKELEAFTCRKWLHAIHTKLNNKFQVSLKNKRKNPFLMDFKVPLAFMVVKVDNESEADQTVKLTDAGRGIGGTANMLEWGGDETDIPHEFGHMLGAKDQYGIVDGYNYGSGRTSGKNVMNDPSGDFDLSCLSFLQEKFSSLSSVITDYGGYNINIIWQ